jgi:Tuberculosis necrotizing toxin
LTQADILKLDGRMVDRIGHPGGAWLAPEGTPYEGRALPHDSLGKEVHQYIIHADKGLPPGWKLEESLAAPWFGHPGGGPQYRLIAPPGAKARIQDLIDRGFLEDMCDQYYGAG